MTTAPRCIACGRLHLLELPCWRSKYSARVTRAVLRAQGTVCWLCGEDGATTADHVVPRSKCGDDTPGNLRSAHRSCNSRRRDLEPFALEDDRRPAGVPLSPRWRPKG